MSSENVRIGSIFLSRTGSIPTVELPVWRSLLYVPTTVSKFVEGAADRGADAIILDLEDSVAPTRKDEARTLLSAAVAAAGRKGADVLVRVNRPWRMLVRDVEAAIRPGIRGLVLTKVESAEHLDAVAEIVAELEAEQGMPVGAVQFYALIETASGLLNTASIARHPRLVALSVGTDDLAQSFGSTTDVENLFYPKQHGIVAARAAGILPLGFLGSHADFRDLEKFRMAVRRSRRMGFAGTTCIHPDQVGIANEEHSPSPEELSAAQQLISAYEAAMAQHTGAFEFEGKMVDKAIVNQAYALIRIDEAICRRMAMGQSTTFLVD
jgi:citrate lyase subunit beta/citryl-CoA lyase